MTGSRQRASISLTIRIIHSLKILWYHLVKETQTVKLTAWVEFDTISYSLPVLKDETTQILSRKCCTTEYFCLHISFSEALRFSSKVTSVVVQFSMLQLLAHCSQTAVFLLRGLHQGKQLCFFFQYLVQTVLCTFKRTKNIKHLRIQTEKRDIWSLPVAVRISAARARVHAERNSFVLKIFFLYLCSCFSAQTENIWVLTNFPLTRDRSDVAN